MKIVCQRMMGYERTKIYIMQFGLSFQYLFAWNDEIWQDRAIIRPNWWRYALYLLRLAKTPYSAYQLEQGEEVALCGAMKTIDRLKDPAVQKEIKKAKHQAKINSSCMWQVRTAETGSPRFAGVAGEKCYYCLKHDKTVAMEDGKQPRHTN